jgi:Alpha-glutamyl/putrescinyl thymine pyrophosphorylase clade 3
MRPRDRKRANELDGALNAFHRKTSLLPAIGDAARRACFIEQVLESKRRVDFYAKWQSRQLSERRTEPSDNLFDPIKAAIVHRHDGKLEEAFWLTFLAVHFGRHRRLGWRLVRDVYGCLGSGNRWDWASTSADPSGFRDWFESSLPRLRNAPGPNGFGNHRKYESLSQTGSAVSSYVNWVGPQAAQAAVIDRALDRAGGDGRVAFDDLFRGMAVLGFGRTAKFDFLCMIGNLGLGGIEPGSVYLSGATGPLAGARLLTSSQAGAPALEDIIAQMDEYLGVGMQVLEDALCNWQKSPDNFQPFRG